MKTTTRVSILNGVSYLLLLLFLGLAGALAVLYVQAALTEVERNIGTAVLLLLLLCWLYTQRIQDRWLLTAIERVELSDEESFYLLFSNSPVTHMVINQSGKIIDFNPAAVQLLKAKADTLREYSLFSFLAPDFDSSLFVSKLRAGLTINELELPLRTFAGGSVWGLLSVSSLNRRGELLATLVDITEQKKVDTAKSEFVALATHQLRTPVAAIRYAAELLNRRLSEGATERNYAYLDKVNRNVVRMLALIDDFLNVSKLEMGTFATEVKSVNLSTFVTGILDEFEDRIQSKQITLARQDNPTDLWCTTDPRLLNIILSNLISNAVKYTPEGGRIDVVFTEVGANVRFEVIDSGIGIPAAEIPQLFNKFFRASNARSIQSEGTGLGLYIVQQAAEQLGGTIAVASDTGAGTHFTVTLPL